MKAGAESFRFLFLAASVGILFWSVLGGYTRDYTYRNIRARLSRGQILQARTFFRAMFLLIFIFSVLITAGIVLFAAELSGVLFGSSSFSLLFYVCAPVLFFLTISDLFAGLFLGEGIGIPILITEAVSIVIFGLGSFLSRPLFSDMGLSVGMLLKNSDMQVAYECMGIMLAALLASFIRFVLYLIFYFLVGKDTLTDVLENAPLLHVPVFMGQIATQAYPETFLHMNVILPFVLYPVLSLLVLNPGSDHTYIGYLAGFNYPLLLILYEITRISCIGRINELAHLKKLDDFKKFKNALVALYQGHLFIIFPICAYIFAAAQILCQVLGSEDAAAIMLLRYGAVSMSLFSLFWLTRKTMRLWKVGKSVCFMEMFAHAISILFLLFVPAAGLGEAGKVMVAILLDQILLLCIDQLLIRRKIKLHPDLVEDWIKPMLCALISAFVVFVLISAFGSAFSVLILFVVTAVLYFVIFMALLLALRCIHPAMARFLPGSAFWLKLAEVFHLS